MLYGGSEEEEEACVNDVVTSGSDRVYLPFLFSFFAGPHLLVGCATSVRSYNTESIAIYILLLFGNAFSKL